MKIEMLPPGTKKNRSTAPRDRNIFWTEGKVTHQERESRNRHRSCIIWMTGLSGAGKTTVAQELERELFNRGCQVMVLDGDNVRHGLNSDLGFSAEDREENIRRIGEASRLLIEAGIITITAFISPYSKDRDRVRNIAKENEFIEVFIKCSLEECERRDTKGLYKKARAGLIKNFTGIDDPFEIPRNPEIIVDTEELTVSESVDKILGFLIANKLIESEEYVAAGQGA